MGVGASSEKQLLDQIFNLKFTSKQLTRSANKCVKDEKSEKLKVKKAIEKGNIDGARIYAQNAIRKHTEQLNYLKLASRLDAVVSKLETQSKMNTVNKSMAGIVKALDRALQSNNLEQVSQTMDQFEKQFESLDVQSECVQEAMGNQQAMSTPEDEVNNLMMQVADEHGLETGMLMPNAGVGTVQPQGVTQQQNEEDDLANRLANLRGA
ncbi:intracellular transport protein [Chloropicon primus]|uniref:Intracellular transport protein n=1 Tax=Chloropicon primus TaxID=1764295 RepID=A0A5B8MZF0_9CHLO|nr:intracellular transport protein [Chloropicon primus]|mmetsp:Transcript_5152/g.15478  ORF Transcript_5152/g.15478 Transcript_5152/m.15478 type:complete len:209 (-) Transcript_5152:858-1484(-)|eukprot:QDZ25869.1 intracellular transport protein [Chloropicon primus]